MLFQFVNFSTFLYIFGFLQQLFSPIFLYFFHLFQGLLFLVSTACCFLASTSSLLHSLFLGSSIAGFIKNLAGRNMNLAGLTVVDMDWFGFMLGIVSLDEVGENISSFSFGFTAVDSFKVVVMEGSVLMSS